MSQEYFYLDGNNQNGPLSIDQLKSVGIKPDTLVWTAGFDDWKPAKDVEELKTLFSLSPPPTPVIKMAKSGVNNSGQGQTIIVNHVERQSNGVGLVGFIVALSVLLFFWAPVAWIIWIIGFILSTIGMFRKPKGLAIAGFVISLVTLILILVVFKALAGWLSFLWL